MQNVIEAGLTLLMSPLERLLAGRILCESFRLDREVERQDKEKIALKRSEGINMLEYF